MKKVILLLAIALFTHLGASAQQVQVNVHIFGGNERIYFDQPHSWMLSHGYHYHRNGYYMHSNGKRINPNRREAYRKGNNGNHYGQYKRKSNGNGKKYSNGHKQGKGHK